MNVPLAIEAVGVGFSYDRHRALTLERCELANEQSMAVIGPSGCGKTTLLHLLAGLIRPSSGTIRILGQDISKLRATEMDRFRGQHLGLVFQRFHLLSALTVEENVVLAQRLARNPIDPARVRELFDRLDIAGLEHHKPSMLSQGQAQRVAIARALVHGPQLVLADEPTSALDDHQAQEAIALLSESAREIGTALLIVTHDQRVRGRMAFEFDLTAKR